MKMNFHILLIIMALMPLNGEIFAQQLGLGLTINHNAPLGELRLIYKSTPGVEFSIHRFDASRRTEFIARVGLSILPPKAEYFRIESGDLTTIASYSSQVFVPLLVEGHWNLLPNRDFSPYLGVALGYVYSYVNVKTLNQYASTDLTYGGNGCLAPVAGFGWDISDRLRLSLDGRFNLLYSNYLRGFLKYYNTNLSVVFKV